MPPQDVMENLLEQISLVGKTIQILLKEVSKYNPLTKHHIAQHAVLKAIRNYDIFNNSGAAKFSNLPRFKKKRVCE